MPRFNSSVTLNMLSHRGDHSAAVRPRCVLCVSKSACRTEILNVSNTNHTKKETPRFPFRVVSWSRCFENLSETFQERRLFGMQERPCFLERHEAGLVDLPGCAARIRFGGGDAGESVYGLVALGVDRKSTRLHFCHRTLSRMPSS